MKKGFTLAEIVIALIVCSVIAGVTIGVTKSKVETAVAYYYYAGYTALQTAADEIVRNDGVISDPCNKIADKLNTITSNCAAGTMTLRSGAILTGFSYSDPIAVLNNSSGWNINIDIDGDKRESEPVPVYLTTDGKLVPAKGDNSKNLAVSVKYDDFPDGARQTKWLSKSVSFRQAACESGYVSGTYCATTPAVSKNAVCTPEANCRIVPVKPVFTRG